MAATRVEQPPWAFGRVVATRVKVNAFPVEQLPTKLFYHYDVDIKPEGVETLPKPMSRQRLQDIMDRLSHTYSSKITGPMSYDGQKSMYTVQPDLSGRYEVDMTGATLGQVQTTTARRQKTFTASTSLVNTIDPSILYGLVATQQHSRSQVLTVISLLQHLIHSAPKQNAPASNARSVYTPSGSHYLGYGLELWHGFFHSVRPTIDRVLINVDTTTTIMRSGGELYQVALQHVRGPGPFNVRDILQLSGKDLAKLRLFLKKVLVTIRIPGGKEDNRARPIKDLVENAGDYRFQNRDGEDMTVADYFFRAHLYNLRYGRAFGVKIGRDAVFPGEVVIVAPNQFYKRKVPGDLMSKVLKQSELKPRDKLWKIERELQKGILDYSQSKWLKDANILELSSTVLTPVASFAQGVVSMRLHGL